MLSGRRALSALRAQGMRSALALAALTIGVAGAITASALAAGSRQAVLERLRALGPGVLVVRAREGGVELRDFEQIRRLLGPRARVSAAREVERAVSSGRERPVRRPVLEGDPTGLALAGDHLSIGRPLTWDDFERGRRVCVLRAETARELGVGGPPAGELRIDGLRFPVVGIVTGPAGGGAGIHVPLTALEGLAGEVDEVRVWADPPEAAPQLKRSLESLLSREPRAGQRLETKLARELVDLERASVRVLDWAALGLAGVALVTGGLGIGGMMLATVGAPAARDRDSASAGCQRVGHRRRVSRPESDSLCDRHGLGLGPWAADHRLGGRARLARGGRGPFDTPRRDVWNTGGNPLRTAARPPGGKGGSDPGLEGRLTGLERRLSGAELDQNITRSAIVAADPSRHAAARGASSGGRARLAGVD